MTFKEWAASGGKFHLCGGPFDGVALEVGQRTAWPSVIVHQGHRYTMRIGDLDHYDHVAPRVEGT